MNTNKPIVFSILLFLSLSAFTCKERQNTKIEKITLHYVDLEIETPIQVSCDAFETLFSDSYKTKIIDSRAQLNDFEDYLEDHNMLDSLKRIDVRIKAFIAFDNHKSSILCMDKFNNLVLDNKSIKANQRITDFIRRQIGM